MKNSLLKEVRALFQRLLDRYVFLPVSDKVTRTLIWIGCLLLAVPALNFLILDLIIEYAFGKALDIEYPTTECLVAGLFCLVLAVIHNIKISAQGGEKHIVELRIGENSIKGHFPFTDAKELMLGNKRSDHETLDYPKLREFYQPLISEAVHAIQEGETEKGAKLLRSILNAMPLGIIATAYLNLGYYCASAGDDRAIDYYKIGLRIYEDAGFREELSRVYRNLGESARHSHDFKTAEQWFRKAISVSEELSDKAALADSIAGLGLTFGQQCRHVDAEREFLNSRTLYEDLKATSHVKRINSYLDTLRSCPRYKCL